MASFQYLWQNRAIAPFGTRQYFKTWAKRILSLPEVLRRNRRRNKLIHRGASIHCTTEIGEVTFGGGKKSNLRVGEYSFLGKIYISLQDKIIIGNRVCISDGTQIRGSHNVYSSSWESVQKPIVIENYVWIAINVIILPGVHIGTGAVIGAGAVVSKDVKPYEIVVGNPARPLNKQRIRNLNYNPCEFLASNRAWLVG
jgi:maltose O-acetyltransferase